MKLVTTALSKRLPAFFRMSPVSWLSRLNQTIPASFASTGLSSSLLFSKGKEDPQKEKQPKKQGDKPEQEDDPMNGNNLKRLLRKFAEFIQEKKFLLLLAVAAYVLKEQFLDGKQIDYAEYRKMLEGNEITGISIVRVKDKGKMPAKVRVETGVGRYHLNVADLDQYEQDFQSYCASNNIEPFHTYTYSYSLQYRLAQFVSISIDVYILLLVFLPMTSFSGGFAKNKGSNLFGFMNSKVKQFGLSKKVNVKFADVAGQDQAKLEVAEFVDFLKRPEKFKQLGARIPKGALLSGPPGTGKTMLAKAIAGQAEVPFYFMSGSQFIQIFVGVGASRVRQLFAEAKKNSPSIIFIDQIDAMGKKREQKLGGGANDEKDSTLNQLLVEMDGFGSDNNVIVLAATNRKQLLDPALTRPGRFDRAIDVQLPDLEGRLQIFLIHLKPLKLCPKRTIEEYAKRLATLTPGFSGADISNLCNEAAILAARLGKTRVQAIDFENASDRILAGTQKKNLLSEEQRRVTAYHESGHAVVSWFLKGASPLLKLTIVPRSKGSLGFAQYLPKQSSLQNREELKDKICFILGGRCAEEHFLKRITTGAHDDLKKAYSVAHGYVSKLGMSEKVGLVGYKEGQYSKTYSQQTSQLIDSEIKKLIEECTARTRQMVILHEQHIEGLAKRLLQQGTLDVSQIQQVLGPRPFPVNQSFRAFLEEKKKGETVVG